MKLEILVGMIASGKSTYARKRADEGALVICHDNLTKMLHARYRYDPELREVYQHMMRGLAREAAWAGRDIIVDRTHLTKDSRRLWMLMKIDLNDGRRERDVEVITVQFPFECPEVHARRRFSNGSRGRPYEEWLKVAEHHAAQAAAEPLDWKKEGFDGGIMAPPFELSKPDDPTPVPPHGVLDMIHQMDRLAGLEKKMAEQPEDWK